MNNFNKPSQVFPDIATDKKLSLSAKGLALLICSVDSSSDILSSILESETEYKTLISELEENRYLHIIYCIRKKDSQEEMIVLLNGKKLSMDDIQNHIAEAESSSDYSVVRYKKA